jgi:FdhD protein
MRPAVARFEVREVIGAGAPAEPRVDSLAVEEPLEIRLRWREGEVLRERALAVTMRTPGHDPELAAGFLLSEGVVREPRDLLAVEAAGGVCTVEIADGSRAASDALDRHSYTSSSCGVCGKTSLGSLRVPSAFPPAPAQEPRVAAAVVHELPVALRASQGVFEQTGGLHAAGLFDAAGRLALLREDVGRHNAVDKVAGAMLMAGALPLRGNVLVLSGRASFELVQKASMMGVPVVVAVGAPSSMAVELARAEGITLAGFARGGRFNVYAGSERIVGADRG